MDEFTIAIAVWDGVEELDFAGPYEVLTAWARTRASGRSRVRHRRGEQPTRCACSHGLRVVPDVDAGTTSASSTCSCFPAATRGRCMEDESFLERMRELAAAAR